jgi:site-specific recombinase
MSLGFMLGLIPPVTAFFGLGLEVRHVTLSAGQLAAAGAALGAEVWRLPAFWWCVAAIPLIGLMNLGVSFYLAFRMALQAHSVSRIDRARIRAAIWRRLRQHPRSFLMPG